MNIEQTEKDKKLIELNDKYPRPKDEDIAIIIDTLLKWEEQSPIWLFFVTKFIESSEISISEEQKARLQKLKDKALEDKNLSKEFDELLAKANEPSAEDRENEEKIPALIELGFEPLFEEDALKLISQTDWEHLDYNYIHTSYMLFDGDLTISEKDFKLFHELPIIITGNLIVEGNLFTIFSASILMVLGDLYVKSLYLHESILYVKGILFAKQAVLLSAGDYISQIKSIKAPLLICDDDNTILGSNADIFIDRSGSYQGSDDWNTSIQESILDEYYTFYKDDQYQEDEYDLDFGKIEKALKIGKNILK